MLITQEEAKSKWCPMPCPDNKPPGICPCIASECMMWRWETMTRWEQRLRDGRNSAPGIDMQEVADLLPRKGYCGLAGRIEH